MASAQKPLFRPEALQPKLRSFHLPPRVQAARKKLAIWAAKFDTDKLDRLKETELLPGFLAQIFGELLGYTGPVTEGETYSMKLEANIQVDSNRADATFGTFGGAKDRLALVLEGKGPLDPLDKPFKSRSESAVRQCLSYARNLGLDWYVVTNMRETRIYSKQADERTYESFRIDQLAHKEEELKRFVYLLGVERVIGESGANHLDSLYAESKKIGRELTDKLTLLGISFTIGSMARPKKEERLLLTIPLRIMLTAEQRELIERAASASGSDMTAWARPILLTAARRDLGTAKSVKERAPDGGETPT